ncbi:MAG TPA: nucleotidyltransferase family protein [Armatimonadetes bacterium]|nr:nucleotidyltransferase family protein [Armatimonadota bacterium]
MKAVILAAGYATRLYPLTKNRAKPLLKVAGKPIINYTLERLQPLEPVDRVYVVTNARFYSDFVAWRNGLDYPQSVEVINDGTVSNEDRLGAIGDVRFVVEQQGLADDLLIVAGDNLFGLDLRRFVAFWEAHPGSAVTLRRVPNPELVKQYSEAEVDAEGRVIRYVEKPPHPTTDLVGTSIYLLRREHVPCIARYLDEGGNPDAPGYFISWLYQQVPVYGFEFDDWWFDVGSLDSLRKADSFLRRLQGLSP